MSVDGSMVLAAAYDSGLNESEVVGLDGSTGMCMGVRRSSTSTPTWQLGGFSLETNDVIQPDQLVITEARRRRLPWIMLTSGGYSSASYALITGTCAWAIRSAADWR